MRWSSRAGGGRGVFSALAKTATEIVRRDVPLVVAWQIREAVLPAMLRAGYAAVLRAPVVLRPTWPKRKHAARKDVVRGDEWTDWRFNHGPAWRYAEWRNARGYVVTRDAVLKGILTHCLVDFGGEPGAVIRASIADARRRGVVLTAALVSRAHPNFGTLLRCYVGGVREALDGCGVVVRPRDVDGFANEVHKLLDDSPLRAKLAEVVLHREQRGGESIESGSRLSALGGCWPVLAESPSHSTASRKARNAGRKSCSMSDRGRVLLPFVQRRKRDAEETSRRRRHRRSRRGGRSASAALPFHGRRAGRARRGARRL